MKRFILGIAAMVLMWAVQAQAAEVTWKKNIKPIFDTNCAGFHGSDSPEVSEFDKDRSTTKKGP